MKRIPKGYIKKLLPARPDDSSKSDFGRVLVAAGSKGMTGAAFLASLSALRSGCGLLYCAVPESERALVAGMLPEAITMGLKSEKGRVRPEAVLELEKAVPHRKFDLMVIGPGLGCDEGVARFVFSALENLALPAVIDADAINCFSAFPGKLEILKKIPHIITPHEGELKRLAVRVTRVPFPRVIGRRDSPVRLGDEEWDGTWGAGGAVPAGEAYGNKAARALKLSRLTGGVAVLKGPGTVVAAEGKIYVNDTGCSALAKGGTGDVLAGLIGGLWAQKGKNSAFSLESAFESAVLGVWLHGRTGDLASEALGSRCVLAGDLLSYLPRAFSEAGGGDA